MRRLASELGIAAEVFFTGPRHCVPELLSVSDVCVLSSVSEGFPNVIVEDMAAVARSRQRMSAALERRSSKA